MNEQVNLLRPDYIFEISWEVCNKIGGIHTVLTTKAAYLEKQLGMNYILIGPDLPKEQAENDIFQEDKNLYSQWVSEAHRQGLRIRTGRWNIPGKPVVFLVDFSQYFTQKDTIFASLWETYKLDSLTGGWDYTEPALFGYAATKVVESFYNFHLSAYDKLVVHFHEWKTGAGLLLLKKELPQAGLVFSTHDTVPGRTLSAAGISIFNNDNGNTDEIINKAGNRAKYSLEKLSITNADCYTAVSQLNSDEALRFYGEGACVITPNGFNPELIPLRENIVEHKKECRERIFSFIERFFGKRPSDNCLIVCHSGRNEFRNKGTDIFIDAISALKEKLHDREVYAFLSIPGNHSGPVEHIKKRIEKPSEGAVCEGDIVTHHLLSYENDLILNKIKENKLCNSPNDNIKVIYIPAWLDGNDKVVNIPYFDLLAGSDIGVFPSFYEPWGYTPMECLLLGVPSITTQLSGFGVWVNQHFPDNKALKVIYRDEKNDNEVIESITNTLIDLTKYSDEYHLQINSDAMAVSAATHWENFIGEYRLSFHKALEQAATRIELYKHKQAVPVLTPAWTNKPHWYKVLVNPYFPDSLLPLKELSMNLWWSWDSDAQQLFENINPQLWETTKHNPIALLEMLEIKQVRQLENDPEFISRLNEVYQKFTSYMSAKPTEKNSIAYFCMEYGLHASVKLYSGGLGILAGDYLKEASDTNRNFVAVGLLYRYGYFNQKISPFGDQINEKIPQKFTHLPMIPVRDEKNNWVHVSMLFPGRTVFAKVWKMQVGRISLYLLDTDLDENNEADRQITHQLYGGDWENRLKQELILGIGGIRILRQIGINPDVYHLNEGHAAFLNLERMRYLIQEDKLNFTQAVEVLRSSSLFTTHTPVPAGHDSFEESLLRVYLSHYPQRFNITWEKFINLGKINDDDPAEKFSMSVLALKLSQECNGVSRLHGKVSREMFAGLYPGFFSEELHISYVTNGVHYSTWTAKEWQDILTENNPGSLNERLSDKQKWEHIYNIPDETIWNIRNKYRAILASFMSEKLVKDYTARQEQPHILIQTLENINPDILTIGFARRFATYKRAHLLFSSPERLSLIVNDPHKPVRFLFAGKAHPQDGMGQDLIRKIIQWSKLPEFLGKIIFLDNYDAEIAKKMVQGVDIWLNTPTRPLEASGTSGEKCVMNGVLHLSVLDGWWAEGYLPKAGWALKESRTYVDQKLQDELDSETLYSMLETEIVPMFYNRNQHNIPTEWIQFIKKNLCEIAPLFTTRRMMNDYYSMFYERMFIRSGKMRASNYEKACALAAWKRKTELMWDNLKVVENRCHDSNVRPLLLGENFNAEIVIDSAGIPHQEIGVELLFGQKTMDHVENILFSEELELISSEENRAVFARSVEIRRAGVLDFAVRIFIRHPDLPHKTDFGLVKWG